MALAKCWELSELDALPAEIDLVVDGESQPLIEAGLNIRIGQDVVLRRRGARHVLAACDPEDPG